MAETARFYTDFVDELDVLTPSMLRDQAGAAALDLMRERGFIMTMGLMHDTVPQLTRAAAQPHIVEFAPRDAAERFTVAESAAAWLAKRRFPLVGFAVNNFMLGDTLSEADMRALEPDDLTLADYAWFGPEKNKHIAGADTTTAYRVSQEGSALARQRRLYDGDKFRLGLPLGHITTAVAIDIAGVDPGTLSLETYQSNIAANAMYDIMHYREDPQVSPIECVRPTLKPVGEVIGGNAVYLDEETGLHVVKDYRLNKRYDPTGELTAA